MEKTRVLTVESNDDSATRSMLETIYCSIDFEDYEVIHCFIENSESAEDLFREITEDLSLAKASIVLIHTGREFERLKDIFPSVLERLKRQNPGLSLGIQNRKFMNDGIKSVISKGQNIEHLENKFFEKRGILNE